MDKDAAIPEVDGRGEPVGACVGGDDPEGGGEKTAAAAAAAVRNHTITSACNT